jgi:hypothetical protein
VQRRADAGIVTAIVVAVVFNAAAVWWLWRSPAVTVFTAAATLLESVAWAPVICPPGIFREPRRRR